MQCIQISHRAALDAASKRYITMYVYSEIYQSTLTTLRYFTLSKYMITSLVKRLVASCKALGGTVLTSVRNSSGVEITYNDIHI